MSYEPHDPSGTRHSGNDFRAEVNRTSWEEQIPRTAEKKEEVIDQVLSPTTADTSRFASFTDVEQLKNVFDESIEEQKKGHVTQATALPRQALRNLPKSAPAPGQPPASGAPQPRNTPRL